VTPGWQKVHLDEIPGHAGPGTLTWHAVRATLDVRAFGTNAYTADREGVDVVEPHSENEELAHEELYFVHRGSARFTLDGESFDAPEGTYVVVTDPKVHRDAVALEAGTTILSFGGPRTFKPSAWEYGWRAARAGDPDEARRILDEGEREWPESARIAWDRAGVENQAGNREAALAALEQARERVPAEHAEAMEADMRKDPDLAGLFD
jgi:tetratricopeptide (TPR) repeat protein